MGTPIILLEKDELMTEKSLLIRDVVLAMAAVFMAVGNTALKFQL